MRTITYWLSLVMIFVVPWENVVAIRRCGDNKPGRFGLLQPTGTPVFLEAIHRCFRAKGMSIVMTKTGNRVSLKFDRLASDYSSKYDRSTSIFGIEKTRRSELLVEYAQLLKPRCILDAGCGPGVVLSALTRRLLGAKFAGVDLSFQMLRQAQSNNLEGVPFVQSSVEQLPFPDNFFDLIYALGVLDYLETPDRFFKAVQRTVRPGGYFIFTYPNADSIARSLRASLRPHFGHSRTVISAIPLKRATVDRLITDHGFTLLRQHYITYGNGVISFPWSISVNRKMEKWCGQRPVSRYLAWSCFCVAQKGRA